MVKSAGRGGGGRAHIDQPAGHDRQVDYAYTDGRLTEVTTVVGHKLYYQYDQSGMMTGYVDPAGRTHAIEYDDYRNVMSVKKDLSRGYAFQFDYDEGKKESYARMITPQGKVKEVWFDADGDTRRVDINGRTVQKISKDGRHLIITDQQGNQTRKEYDEWDNLTRIIHPDGSTRSYQYEHTFNRVVKAIDENGRITRYEYDASGNMITKKEAVGTGRERITTYTYDGDGNRLTVKREGDARTAEVLTVSTYDAAGNMISMTDGENNTVFFTHDIMGNVLTQTGPDNQVRTYVYDEAGRLKSTTDPLNNEIRFYYDEAGNKIKETDADGRETLYQYDGRDNLIKKIDPLLNETVFEYNGENKLIKQTDPEGNGIYYHYDSEGRLTKTVDGNGNEIRMEYDDDTPCASCSGSLQDLPKRTIYPAFVKEYEYDVKNRKTKETDIAAADQAYTTRYGYDDAGNLISKIDKEDHAVYYEYDELNRLKKVIDALGGETVYTYDNQDNLIELVDAKGQMTRFEYDKKEKKMGHTKNT